MKKPYFFIATSLPQLKIGSPLEIRFPELMNLYEMNLTAEDLKKVKKIRQLIDLKNVKEILRDGTIDPRGNYDRKELEDALLNEKNLPEYLFDYLQGYDNEREQVRHYAKVMALFFARECITEKGFLREYFQFERNFRLLLTAYRAKAIGIDLSEELKYEDLQDPFVAHLLATKDASSVEFPLEFADLPPLLSQVENQPSEQFQKVTRYKMDKISEFAVDDPFSIDWLLAYMILLMLFEDWYELDESRGGEILNKIVKEMT